MSLISAALEVQIADSFCATELIAPGLIALAAVTAAGIAARVAVRNRRAQLDHDRRMRDRDELRQTLDGVMAEVIEVLDRSNEAASAMRKAANETDPELRARAKEHGLEREEIARVAAIQLVPANARLRLRLPKRAPIVLSLQTLEGELEKRHTAIRDALTGLGEHHTDEEAKRLDALGNRGWYQAGLRVNTFLETCRNHFDSDPAD